MENNGSDYSKMVSNLEKFNQDFTTYNLLQFFLLNFLKNRFEPSIAISNGKTIDLNQVLIDFCKAPQRPEISCEGLPFELINDPQRITELIEKLQVVKSEWQIYASEYGMALGIMLNEIEKKYQLFSNRNEPIMESE